ncbi:F0F1 ATP synthase subunit delta [Curtobacterium sp. MCBD17_028]|uniref:F0F1 ATP synthase subunit delta n=1 Tax=Curtobacterium sp. MCBD17_028 TaxID=2175670 RepID=UPI000DA87D36|nr:F0F1 ATP synthase subunit delta [Curtobacterium sp. MCBD17_028]PZE28862.1 F0F1 ATP synthase subunit delta [Curtobacterium sp. MCBD17_028]
MRSATRTALEAVRETLAELGDAADLSAGVEILSAGRTIAGAPQLLGVFGDATADADGKRALVQRVFASRSDAVRAVLSAVVAERWSSHLDLLAGIEDAGIRALARSAGPETSIERELFTFETAVRSDADLELALGTKLGSPEQKAALVERLLDGKASAQTIAILSALVQQPRGRRIGEIVRAASEIVAAEADQVVAVVISAAPLEHEQRDRLGRTLANRYGRTINLNEVVDPTVVGGIRVQVGGDVIDGTVNTRLQQLRLEFAG